MKETPYQLVRPTVRPTIVVKLSTFSKFSDSPSRNLMRGCSAASFGAVSSRRRISSSPFKGRSTICKLGVKC